MESNTQYYSTNRSLSRTLNLILNHNKRFTQIHKETDFTDLHSQINPRFDLQKQQSYRKKKIILHMSLKIKTTTKNQTKLSK